MAEQHVSTANICDATLGPVDVVEAQTLFVVQPGLLRDFGGHKRFHGPAATVKCQDSNVMVRHVVESAGQGRVLVVDTGGSLRCAVLGDNLAELAVKNGWRGVIVNGCVRDTAQLAGLPLGIKALAPCPVRSSKRDPGVKAVRVIIGGVLIRPDDYIYCDEDGVLVSHEGPVAL